MPTLVILISWTADPRSPYAWAGDMPPVTLMASLIPLLVFFIKAVQVIHAWALYFYHCLTAGRTNPTVVVPHDYDQQEQQIAV